MKNGQIAKRGKWEGGRWCSFCNQYHGHLAICTHYPEELKKQIEKESNQWKKNLRSKSWVKKQMKILTDGGLSECQAGLAIATQKIFAGIYE